MDRRDTLNFTFKIVFVLAAITILISANYSILFNYIQNNDIVEWIVSFCLNIGAGFLGSIILIYVYDRTLQKEKEKERANRRMVVLAILNKILVRQLEMLFDIAWCAGPNPLKVEGRGIKDIFDTQYFNQVNNLDPGAPSPPKVREYRVRTFGNYIIRETNYFRDKITDLLYKYQDILDSTMLDILEKINETKFILYGHNLAEESRLEWDRRYKDRGGLDWRIDYVLRPYTELLIDLTELYNKECPNNQITADQILELSKWQKPGLQRYLLMDLSPEKRKKMIEEL